MKSCESAKSNSCTQCRIDGLEPALAVCVATATSIVHLSKKEVIQRHTPSRRWSLGRSSIGDGNSHSLVDQVWMVPGNWLFLWVGKEGKKIVRIPVTVSEVNFLAIGNKTLEIAVSGMGCRECANEEICTKVRVHRLCVSVVAAQLDR